MKQYFFEAEFNDLHIKLTKQALHDFIKKMMEENFSLYWRYEDETIFLIIDNEENIYEIPFIRNDNFLTLNVDKMTVNDEIIVDSIEFFISQFNGNGVIKKYTDGPLYITSYKTGLIQSITEIDGSEKIIMNKHGSIVEYKEYGKDVEPQILYNIMTMEIDYELMELHEALQLNDNSRICKHKKKLKKLLNCREEVEQLM